MWETGSRVISSMTLRRSLYIGASHVGSAECPAVPLWMRSYSQKAGDILCCLPNFLSCWYGWNLLKSRYIHDLLSPMQYNWAGPAPGLINSSQPKEKNMCTAFVPAHSFMDLTLRIPAGTCRPVLTPPTWRRPLSVSHNALEYLQNSFA